MEVAHMEALLPKRLEFSPFEWYRTMRESTPVLYDRTAGCWQIFRYDDVFRIANDPATFSSSAVQSWRRIEEAERTDFPPTLIGMDPPRHRQFRGLLTQAFTPRAVARLTPRIAVIANELVDRVIYTGTLDVIDDIAYPLPVMVIAELLGVPVRDRPRFKRWSDAVIAADVETAVAETPTEGFRRRRNAARCAAHEMRDYFSRILAERRQRPQPDLISDLLAAEIDGQRLTEDQLLGFCILLLVAGNITTTNLLGNAMVCFDEHPEAIETLRREPSWVPKAVEEVLRYRSPAKMLVRIAATDTTIAGHAVAQGQLIVAWIGSANHDEARFPDPERFDVHRTPNPHLAFGHGIHFCVGAPLARLEAKIALQVMLERLPRLKRVPGMPLEPIDSPILCGVRHYRATFRSPYRAAS
jgi:cytochrome P450 family 109